MKMLAKKPRGRPKDGPASNRLTRRHRATRPQILTRKALDGRTNAARDFDRMASAIENDLGGHDQLSTIERALIEGFCGVAVHAHGLNTRLLMGQEIDIGEHALVCSAMVRIASRLGIARRPRDITGLRAILSEGIARHD